MIFKLNDDIVLQLSLEDDYNDVENNNVVKNLLNIGLNRYIYFSILKNDPFLDYCGIHKKEFILLNIKENISDAACKHHILLIDGKVEKRKENEKELDVIIAYKIIDSCDTTKSSDITDMFVKMFSSKNKYIVENLIRKSESTLCAKMEETELTFIRDCDVILERGFDSSRRTTLFREIYKRYKDVFNLNDKNDLKNKYEELLLKMFNINKEDYDEMNKELDRFNSNFLI